MPLANININIVHTSVNLSTLEGHQASSFDGLAQTVTQRDGLQFTEFRKKIRHYEVLTVVIWLV